MSIKTIFESRLLKGILIGIGIILVLAVDFQIGVFVGFKKAMFSYNWGANYYRNFSRPNQPFIREFQGRDFINPHGVLGTILKINSSSIAIKGSDGIEKTIIADNNTTIHGPGGTLKITDLQPNENIIVIGDPDSNGEIKAKLIRIMPEVPAGMAQPENWRMPPEPVSQNSGLPYPGLSPLPPAPQPSSQITQ